MAREEMTAPAVVPVTKIRRDNVIRVGNEAVLVLRVTRLDDGRLRISYKGKDRKDSIAVDANSSTFRFSLKPENR